MAYLCIGYVDHFYVKLELQAAGWRERLAVADLVCFDESGKMNLEGNEVLFEE